METALDAATDILDLDSDVFLPRERCIEVLEMLIDEAGEQPYSWAWFARASRAGVCRIDRVKTYAVSGNLKEVV